MIAACRRSVVGGLCALAFLTACAAPPADLPPDVAVGKPEPMPTPRTEPNDAVPDIVKMHFSSLDVRRGETWSGDFVTGTNVASVEVRTNLFSIDVPRTAYGRFHFELKVLDAPQIFVRSYRLRVIARNSAGIEFEQDLPFELR